MKQALLTSFATRFDYLMFGDEVVVRNFKKVIALFSVHFKECPEEIKHILADPEFEGLKAKEQIFWSTDLFESKPRQLSSLEGDERLKYQGILDKELESIKEVLVRLPFDVASFLLKAITYYDESTIFCADDKVVIAEWGMRPKGEFAVHMLSLEGIKPKQSTPSSDTVANQPISDETPEENISLVDTSNETICDAEEILEVPVAKEIPNQEMPNQEDGSDMVSEKTKNKEEAEKKKKKWWLWLLLGLFLVLLLALLLRRCGKEDTNTPPPVVEEEDLEWVDYSRIVNNRLILLFSDQKSVDDFVKAFRKLYPDKKKYQLYVPDHDLPRIELTLPSEEREEMKNRLPKELSEFDLMVINESVFVAEKTFSDPAFKDAKKSWYFDMIKVSNAWDYTTGNPNLVVAIIDDGFDLEHPELKKKDIVKPYNAVTHNNKVFPIPGSGHGTHIASIAVGLADNGEGSAGIAPTCKLMPIQVANKNGIMTSSAIVDAALYAIKNGADVVNMSLGQQFNAFVSSVPVNVQEQIIATQFLDEEKMWKKIFGMGMSNGKDIAFVIAGGNADILIGIDPMQRIPGTIRVSAVESSKKKASFSNYGDYSVLSAPGVDIYNAVSGSKKYDVCSGTSMAAPMVSGAFALVKSYYPYLSVMDITKLLQHTGIPSLSKVGNIINFADAFNYMGNPEEGRNKEKPIFNDPTDPTNPVANKPNDGLTNPLDPITELPEDPITTQPLLPFDPGTGGEPVYKVDPGTGTLIPINPTTGEPVENVDPWTGLPAPIEPGTNKPIYIDPPTGRPAPIDPETNKPIYIDPPTGRPAPVNPLTGKPTYIDPWTGRPAPIDPVTNKPEYLDPTTGLPAPIDSNTGKPIYVDPRTGQPAPVDPITHLPIYSDPNQPVVDPCPDCTEAQRRYQEYMRLIEELKRSNPGCY